MKDVDLDEPTLFLDHAYLGCTQREFSNRMKQSLNRRQRYLNHVFLLEQQKNYRDGKNFMRKL